MHKIFGEKLNTNYRDRAGAYLICINGGKIAVVKTPKGFFLLGGGFEADESAEVCIARECIEEIGYTVKVGDKLCSAEHYTYHKRIGYFHPIQHYYMGELIHMEENFTIEKDHTLMWLGYDEIKGKMFSPMQNWALDMAWKKVHDFDLSRFVIENRAPSAEEYNQLRISSGIGGAKDIEKARTAMKNSLFAVSVYDGNKLIGSGRIIGDGGVSFAVTDIMVDKAYQNRGIGEEIMNRIDIWFSENTDENAFIMLIANKPADNLYSRHKFEYLSDSRLGMLRNQNKE